MSVPFLFASCQIRTCRQMCINRTLHEDCQYTSCSRPHCKGKCSKHIAPLNLNVGTGWRRVVNSMPYPYCAQEKNPLCPLSRRLGGPHSLDGLEKYCILARKQTPNCPAGSLVAILTKLFQLQYNTEPGEFKGSVTDVMVSS
jgi:hypothetical protein